MKLALYASIETRWDDGTIRRTAARARQMRDNQKPRSAPITAVVERVMAGSFLRVGPGKSTCTFRIYISYSLLASILPAQHLLNGSQTKHSSHHLDNWHLQS